MSDLPRASDGRLSRLAPVLLFGSIGTLLMFYPSLVSGFARMVGPAGDPRLLNYLLEHTWRWLLREPLHASLWDPPFYHPALNAFALSDVLLGVAPLYWLPRGLGLSPENAYQSFLLLSAGTTFLTTFALFHQGLRRDAFAAAAGAFLFAFGAPRIAQLLHVQLLAHFYLPLTLLALIRIVQSDRRESRWSAVFVGALLLQLYAAFYLAWFLALALGIALLIAMLRADSRRVFARVLRRNAVPLAVCGTIATLLVLPLAWHYLTAARLVGARDWQSEVVPYLPVPQSWIFVGPRSLLYGAVMSADFFEPTASAETMLGIGFVTTVLAVAGLVWARRERAVALIGITALVLVLLSTYWPPGWSAWRAIFELVPGAAAVRAVARVGLLVLLALALGFALSVERLRRRSTLLAALVITVPILEQLQYVPSVDRRDNVENARRIAARLGAACPSFYYAVVAPDARALPYRPWKYQLDAMHAQLLTRTPTVNGYSGWMPPAWQPLYHNVIAAETDTAALRARLHAWAPTLPPPCIVTSPAERAGTEY